MKKNDIRSNLEKEISNSRSNYPYKKQSFGGIMNIIASPEKYLNRDLSFQELRILGENLEKIKEDDYIGSLYPSIKTTLFLYSNGEISLPNIDSFQNFRTEYDLIKHLVLKMPLSGLKLDSLAFKNAQIIREFPENNIFKNLALNPINVDFLDAKMFGFKGFISMRMKEVESSIEKLILEDFDFRYPNEEELKKRGYIVLDKKLNYYQDKCYDELLGLEQAALTSGKDIYDYFVDFFELDDKTIHEKIKSILNRYFIDYVGGLIVAPQDMILDIDKQLKKGLGTKLNRLAFRTKDYLSQKIKDHSITHAFNGNYERCAIELKLIPVSLAYNAYIGEYNHPSYKIKQKTKLAFILKNYPEYNSKFANLCYAKKTTPQKVLGPLNMVPKNEVYDKFDWNDIE